MKSMDFFAWQERSREFGQPAGRLRSGTGLQACAHTASAGGVNSWLFTTSATRPGGKRRDVMVRYALGLVLVALGACSTTDHSRNFRHSIRRTFLPLTLFLPH